MHDPLRIVSWNLTRACNLACGHCYLDAEQRRAGGAGELDTTEARDVIGQIADLAPGAMLVLTGGEPLLRSDLDALVATAADRGLLPVIGTNGVSLSPARAAALRHAGAVGAGISLDSIEPDFHDRLRGVPSAHQRALSGVAAARDAGLFVQLQTTLFPETVSQIEDMASLAEQQGAMALHFFFLVCTGRGVTQTDMPGALYEQALHRIQALQARHPGMMVRARCAPYMRRLAGLKSGEGGDQYTAVTSACLAGRSYLRITPEGVVTPCPYVPTSVGALSRTPLAEIWNGSPDLQRLRTELPRGKCGLCDFRVSCGGCRARALAVSGDIMGEDPKCGYLPPAGVAPEPSAVQQVAGRPHWSGEAEAMLARIPGFVRDTVRRSVEQAAKRDGLETITLGYMRARKPASLSFSRPRSG
jgi:radical SAM protein with 4Fe4S-binding SPASM domain